MQKQPTPSFLSILNKLKIRVIGTNQFIYPLHSQDSRYWNIADADENHVRLNLKLAHSGNELDLVIAKKDSGYTIKVERFVVVSLVNYTCDLYFMDKLLLDGIGGPQCCHVGRELALEIPPQPIPAAPFRPLFEVCLKIPEAFSVKEIWRRDGYYPPDDNYVSIVIPNCNGIEWLKPCIESVYEKTDFPFELIIVDDGSTEKQNFEGLKELVGEVMPYPMTILLREERKGFADTCNLGIKVSSGKYIMLLNNDTTIQTDGWLRKLIECAHDENVGIVGCRLLFPNGRLQHGGGKIRSDGAAFHPHHSEVVRRGDFSGIDDVDFVTFAAVLIKRQVIDVIGGFDYQTFPHGYEDVDYCVRAWEAGIRVRYCGTVTLTHYESATDKKLKIQKTKMRVFQDKWHHKGGRWR